MKNLISISAIFVAMASQSALAEVCDYTPSQLIGGKTTVAVEGAAVATAAAGVGLKAAGIYTITHATTGAAMLGSTAAGASAAGTTGIIAGSAGILGTVGAVLMSPFVVVPAAIVAVGVGAYEGACYFASDSAEEVSNKPGTSEEVTVE